MTLAMHTLIEMSIRFGFKIDTRGTYPVMVSGLRAMEYRRHKDAINFISIRHETLVMFGVQSADNFEALRANGYLFDVK